MSVWTPPKYEICVIKLAAKYSEDLVEGSGSLIFHMIFSTYAN